MPHSILADPTYRETVPNHFRFYPYESNTRRRKFGDNTLPCLRLPASRNRASTLVLSARATKLNRIPASLSSLPLLNDQTAQRDVPHQA